MTNSWALRSQAALAAEEQVLRQLLRDGRAADHLGCARRRRGRRRLAWRLRARRSSCVELSARASARWLRSQAFSIASHSTPLCSAKPASSQAITARLRCRRMRVVGHPLLAPQRSGCLLDQQPPGLGALEGGGLRVDHGHQRDAQRRKYSCSASAHSTQQRQPGAAAPARPAHHRRRGGQPLAQRGQHRRGVGHARRATAQKASAACSTSMPRPSRPRAPWRCGPGDEGAAPRRRTSCPAPARRAAAPAPRTGTAAPAQAAGAGVDDDVEAAAAVGQRRWPTARRRAPRQRRVPLHQRLRLVQRAVGHAPARPAAPASSGPERAGRRAAGADQQHAPAGAAARRRCARCRAPGRCRRCCRPSQPSASKRSVLAACASAARGVPRGASAKASNLNGTVTLQPRAARLGGEARAPPSAKSSSGHSRRP